MLSAKAIVSQHDELNSAWHHSTGNTFVPQESDAAGASGWLCLVARQHRANFELWHIED
jgi:hypothetical protein